MDVVLRLSHHARNGLGRNTLNSIRRECNYTNSKVVLVSAQYLASILEREIECCFLENQVTRWSQSKQHLMWISYHQDLTPNLHQQNHEVEAEKKV